MEKEYIEEEEEEGGEVGYERRDGDSWDSQMEFEGEDCDGGDVEEDGEKSGP